jgi:hypothetical protein
MCCFGRAHNQTSSSEVSAIAIGNTLIISAANDYFLSGASITHDNTGETNTWSANLAPGQLARIDEWLADPAGIPPAGFYSGLFVYTPTVGTFGTTANGSDNGATVVDALDNSFTSHFGIAFGPPTTNGSLIVRYSDWFDPTTVSIGWDGNTALYLANLGRDVAQRWRCRACQPADSFGAYDRPEQRTLQGS